MPHALFLGSSLATQDRVGVHTPKSLPPPSNQTVISKPTTRQRLRALLVPTKVEVTPVDPSLGSRLQFIKAHLTHAIFDIGVFFAFLSAYEL
jgi:metal iron transporter